MERDLVDCRRRRCGKRTRIHICDGSYMVDCPGTRRDVLYCVRSRKSPCPALCRHNRTIANWTDWTYGRNGTHWNYRSDWTDGVDWTHRIYGHDGTHGSFRPYRTGIFCDYTHHFKFSPHCERYNHERKRTDNAYLQSSLGDNPLQFVWHYVLYVERDIHQSCELELSGAFRHIKFLSSVQHEYLYGCG